MFKKMGFYITGIRKALYIFIDHLNINSDATEKVNQSHYGLNLPNFYSNNTTKLLHNLTMEQYSTALLQIFKKVTIICKRKNGNNEKFVGDINIFTYYKNVH